MLTYYSASFLITSLLALTSLNNAVIPSTQNKLNKLEPIILDIEISELWLTAAVILTAASGAEVPKATNVNPIITVGIPNTLATLELPSTKISAPLISNINPIINNKELKPYWITEGK